MRAQMLERTELPPNARTTYDRLIATRGKVGGPFVPLMYSPDLAGRIADVGTYIRFESPLPAVTRSLAGLTVARHFDCEYEFAGVADTARKAGLRDEVIYAIRDRASLKGLEPNQELIVDFSCELLQQHRVSDATFERVLGALGQAGVAELVATLGYYMLIAATLNAFGVPPPDEFELRLPPESLPGQS